ncbi:hypothetical protein KS4_29260 [Poriferisphaera corsica]|uniref:Uncharacterized protein n=1 Tax=Poriferisphaera corsica TaxID=2528020 RepID=A0A517YXA7_9BACT|nr:hypothetical protein [Poriferisphaera corsica]QDU34850.1 hypothetical protein KS4_29260 [Poriferisphaera corsica]
MNQKHAMINRVVSAVEVGPCGLIELFCFSNLAFLTIDIYFAHSINAFAMSTEWIPFYFSIVGSVALIVSMIKGKLEPNEKWSKVLGLIVGWGAVITGVLGMIYHLESRFFKEYTLASLVYAAPFAAPLSYTGIGLLLIMNRTVKYGTRNWWQWVIVLGLGGFAGNFVLSVLDHAQNGFYEWTEWIPVIASAVAVGVLIPLIWERVTKAFLLVVVWVMVTQMLVGGLGFYFHGIADLQGSSESMWENLVFGAPIFAPLLFANIALLVLIGLWGGYIWMMTQENESDH